MGSGLSGVPVLPKHELAYRLSKLILEKADPEEPPGSPGPGEVERAIDILEWLERQKWREL